MKSSVAKLVLLTVVPLAAILAVVSLTRHSAMSQQCSNCIELAGDVMGIFDRVPQASPSFGADGPHLL